LIIGYYFGATYNTIDHYLNLGGYLIAAALIIIVALAYLQRKYFSQLGKKIHVE
jgi:membrane protein DedA with SNARE-associated domain